TVVVRVALNVDPETAQIHAVSDVIPDVFGGVKLDSDSPRVASIEIFPKNPVVPRPGMSQQMRLLATYTDGSVRDVTRLACFSSSDEAVATVEPNGLVIGQDRGEAAILVRFLDKLESATMMFLKEIPGFHWNSPPENNFVDHHVFAKLEQLQILPSDLCTDEEFIRRVYLDVIGVLPETSETASFLADADPNKRAKVVDALLERPEYADFWALKWGDLLRIRNAKVSNSGVHKFHRWLVAVFRDNMPYDQFARELLTADGSTFVNPPANYFRTAAETNDCTETTSQLFLGIRIQCAKCHNHPFERWTQDNYYGMAAFFNRVQRKKTGRPDEVFVYFGRSGEVIQPRTGKQMKPWLPLSGEIDPPAESDRREMFVDWLVKPDNPFFAKVEANRIWSYLLGRGIVEPADDFRDSNPPSNAALLAALAKDFAGSGFDRKHLIRTILNSRTYQASSRTNKFNSDDSKYFSHYQPRMLGAEQLLDAICHVSAVPESFAGLPSGTKATQLPSPDLAKSDFLKIFGQPERQTVCACERSTESNLGQALQLYNGPLVHGKLRAGNNRFRQLAASKKSDNEIITQLYLAAFSREPGERELAAANRHIAAKPAEFGAHIEQLKKQLEGMPKQKPDEKLDEAATKAIAELKKKIADLTKQHADPEFLRMQAFEDICWVIINMNEFLFQH
ncbi:MAG: DUF1553 domain-containing protein, partial [Planctomycetes bacterium]|nr:DUF1553 domain-containing protein [Planctomycetota bacterium]